MKDQHKKITGYRDLTQTEIDLMNEIKEHGKLLECLVIELEHNTDIDHRWLSIGNTDLQKGMMALTRAVAKPDSF